MQIRIEEIKNTAKFLLFKSLRASRPIISLMLTFSPRVLVGGVFGKVKLKMPNTMAAIPAMAKVFFRSPRLALSCESQ